MILKVADYPSIKKDINLDELELESSLFYCKKIEVIANSLKTNDMKRDAIKIKKILMDYFPCHYV